MNQKKVHFSKKYRRSRMAEGQPTNSNHRSTLFSVEDSEQLHVESTRARLIQQLVKPDKVLPRDFTAYFHSSTTNSDPACVVTSHHTRDLLPKRRLVIPTYPCTQALRWNPFVETSIDEEPEIPISPRPDQRSDWRSEDITNLRADSGPGPRDGEPEFNCKCQSCTKKRCPSRTPSCSSTRPGFRDNIMTFCDQQTMTPRLNEVGCGCTPVPSTRVSDVSVTASDIAVKETQASMQIHQQYSPEKGPASILKRNGQTQDEYPTYSQSRCCEHAYHPPMDFYQEPEREFTEECIEPSKLSSIRSLFNCKRKDYTNPRRNIYNEGISDLVANHLEPVPVTPIKVASPTNLKKECSKVSVRSRCCLNEGIPYSHRSDSRYHHNCRKSNSRSFYGENDEVRQLVASSEIGRKTYAVKPIKVNKLQSIRMPRRVLTSERDIESYIDRGFPQVIVPVARRPRGH